MRLGLTVLVASTGCAQLFGIDETTEAAPNTDFATVEVQRISIGASLIKSPQDLSAQTAQFYDTAGGAFTAVEGTLAGTNIFQADVDGTPPAVFTVPDRIVPRRMWATPARIQRGNYGIYEHPNPQLPFTTSLLNVQVTLPSAYVSTPNAESFSIQAIGTWMSRTIPAGELPAPDLGNATISSPAIPYSSFNPSAGNQDNRITLADVVLVTRYAAQAGGPAGSSKLTGVYQTQFDQTAGTDMIMGVMTAVQANTPVIAQVMPASYQTRFTAVRPAVAGLSMPWRVNAAPGWSIAADAGVRLINGSSAATDTDVNATFGNPFESLDWKSIFIFEARSSRSYAFTEGANTASVGLLARLETLSHPSSTLSLTMAAGLPITIRANETTLTTDGMMLPLDPTKEVTIDAILDKTANTAYELLLVELGFDTAATPALTRTIVLDALTTGSPTFKIPRSLFTVGKSYYITIKCYQGAYVNVAAGDLQTVSLPFSSGALDSAVFTVGMP